MIDHVSASWGLDENMSMYRHMYNDSTGKPQEEKLGTVNITIQNSIFAEALDTWNHSFGSTSGGENCSFMRNLWANNTGRNPSIGVKNALRRRVDNQLRPGFGFLHGRHPCIPRRCPTWFLMTGREIGAALAVAVLSAVASTAGSLATQGRRRRRLAPGSSTAAGMTALFAVEAMLRMPAARVNSATARMRMH